MVVEAHEEIGRVSAADIDRREKAAPGDRILEFRLPHVITGAAGLGIVVEGIGDHIGEGRRAGRGFDGEIRLDPQGAVGRIIHRFGKRDPGQFEVVFLLREQVVVRSALRLLLGHVGGALEPQFEQLAALGEVAGAGFQLFAGEAHAFGVIYDVEIGLHGIERHFVLDPLQLLDTHQAHHLRGTDGIDPRKAGENGHLPRNAVVVGKVRNVGIGIGLGVDRAAETGRGADRAADRGHERRHGFDIVLAVVAVGVILLPYYGTVFDGIGHALVEGHTHDGLGRIRGGVGQGIHGGIRDDDGLRCRSICGRSPHGSNGRSIRLHRGGGQGYLRPSECPKN